MFKVIYVLLMLFLIRGGTGVGGVKKSRVEVRASIFSFSQSPIIYFFSHVQLFAFPVPTVMMVLVLP